MSKKSLKQILPILLSIVFLFVSTLEAVSQKEFNEQESLSSINESPEKENPSRENFITLKIVESGNFSPEYESPYENDSIHKTQNNDNNEKHKDIQDSEYVSLFIVGDVCPAYNITDDFLYKNKNKDSIGFFTKKAYDLIKSFDVSIMNWETSTSYPGLRLREKKFRFAASPLNYEGFECFTMASVANNHIFDSMERGYEETIANLEKRGILHNGVYSNTYEPLRYEIENKNSAVYFVTGTIWGSSFGKYKTSSPVGIIEQIKKISGKRKTGEKIIVYIHGDKEYEEKTTVQTNVSKKMTEAGADVVLWAHSHVYGPVEKKENSLVAYGMGNFMFGGNSKWRNKKEIKGLHIKLFEQKIEYEWLFFKTNNYIVDCL